MGREVSQKFITVVGDVTRSDVRKEIVDQTTAVFGRLDILICSAGMFPLKGGLTDATEKQFYQVGSCCVTPASDQDTRDKPDMPLLPHLYITILK